MSYTDNMDDKKKKKKEDEKEDKKKETLIESLLREQEEDDAQGTGIPIAIPGDVIPPPQLQRTGSSSGGGGKGGGQMLGTLAKGLMTAYSGGAGAAGGSTFASGFAGAPNVGFKEGGQIKKKTKTKKRVVRGVGAAKRGYGKATYSKKMY